MSTKNKARPEVAVKSGDIESSEKLLEFLDMFVVCEFLKRGMVCEDYLCVTARCPRRVQVNLKVAVDILYRIEL